MKKSLHRRDFLARTLLAAIAPATLAACGRRQEVREGAAAQTAGREPSFPEELALNRQMPRDLVMKMLDQKVDQYMQRSQHCAQSSFLALSDQLGLHGDQVVKALTPMPGIAERGETCGAVTGPVMAMGLIYGRSILQLEDWDRYQNCLIPTGHFCEQFEKEFGTTLCNKVQELKFGRCYQLTDPAELAEFQNAGATEKCSEVVRKAVQLAAGIILDDETL